MKPTALIYSSHNRSELIHRHWIIERALESHHNKTIFFLPMSMRERHQQEYAHGTFDWYFRKFEPYGLRHSTFFWSPHLRREDVDMLFTHLYHDQVVILGGGNSELGLERYKQLGERFYGDRDKFRRVLHERQERGLLTVGFSAGADQLAHLLSAVIEEPEEVDDADAFALARNVMVTLHHERGRERELQLGARRFPHFMVFGLPNDSGIAVSQGQLPSGNTWQVIDFILDTTWDLPKDAWHIKTRMGQKIEHYYADGRHWSFNHGDRMVRVISPDGHWHDAWVITHGQHILHYATQQPTFFHNVEHILRSH
jgi:hypothetical protein